MKYNTFDLLKNVFKILVILSVFSIILILLTHFFSNKEIEKIKNFINEGTKVLYITEYKGYSKEPIELFKKYDIDYMYININKFSKKEKNILKTLTGEKTFENNIVIFNSGKKIDSLLNYETRSKLIKFFQKYHLVPEIIGKNDNIISSVKDYVKNDYMLLYVPYEYSKHVEEQDLILREITDEYDISYKLINAYLLSNSQKEQLNNILQISDVNNQIVILIKNNKILSSIRNVYEKNEYLHELYKTDFIVKQETLVNLDYKSFEKTISLEEKNVIFISKHDCKICNDVKTILNDISNNNEIKIYSVDIETDDSDVSNKIKNKLIEIGYDNGFSVPIVVITESGKILDYTIGNFEASYINDLLLENGVLKGE